MTLPRKGIIGHRLKEIFGDTTLTNDNLNIADFIYVLDNGIKFRMPFDDESGDLLPSATLTENHKALYWPENRKTHYRRNLWQALIIDILTPKDPEERYPDTGRIVLSSGCFVLQLSAAPRGIGPCVDIIAELDAETPVVSIWDCH